MKIHGIRSNKAPQLMNNPDDMWAKQLKGLYFPNGCILDAKKGARASWGWSSLLVGRDLLTKNLLWRVGDGSCIKIWGDKWIPGIVNGCLGVAQPGLNCNLQMVNELIVDGCWNLQDLSQWITEEECRAILSIPLAHNSVADKLIWAGTKNGIYTVKNG